MPIALEPGGTYKVVLETDKGKSPEPAFLFPYLTGRQQRNLVDLFSQASPEPGKLVGLQEVDLIFDTCRKFLTGWVNIPIEFDPNKLEDVVTIQEATQLLIALSVQSPEPEEKND